MKMPVQDQLQAPLQIKICCSCHRGLPLIEFSPSARKRFGVAAKCKQCQREYARAHYSKHTEHYKQKAKAFARSARENFWLLKSATKCTDCGSTFPNEPWLMEFDHLSDKQFEISRLASSGMTNKLERELKQCQPVCVLCHRRRTANRAGLRFP